MTDGAVVGPGPIELPGHGRKVWVCGKIRGPDGRVATSARGLYIEARKSFDRDFFVPRL